MARPVPYGLRVAFAPAKHPSRLRDVATLLAVGFLLAGASPTHGDAPRLTVEPAPGAGPQFKVWNPTPFAAPGRSARVVFFRRGREVHRRSLPLPDIPPFESTRVKIAEWRRYAPGQVHLCLPPDEPSGSAQCSQQVLPGTRPDLSLGATEARGRSVHMILRNTGDVPTGRFEIHATTRAAGRVIGLTHRSMMGLGPRSTRAESIPLGLWGDPQAVEPRLQSPSCCETEVVLDLRDRIREADEGNNRTVVTHGASSP